MLRILPAVLLTSACGLSMQNLPIDQGSAGPSYRVTAVFSDVAHLPPGGHVRIGQATVGRVISLSAKDFQAVAELAIDQGVTLPTGTTAKLELTSALGEEYVLLQPPAKPTGGTLADGAIIPLSDTSRGPDLENTLAALGALLNGSGIDQVRTIVSELNTALDGRADEVRDLVSRLNGVLASLDAHSKDINAVIDSMNALSAQAAKDKPVLEAALTQITPAIDVLLSQRDQFTTLLGDVSTLGKTTNALLDKTGRAITTQLRQLGPVIDSLTGFDAKLGETVRRLATFQGLIGRSIPGDYLNFDGTIDIPGSLGQLLKAGTK